MPLPGGIAGIADFGSGFSATIASVVISRGQLVERGTTTWFIRHR